MIFLLALPYASVLTVVLPLAGTQGLTGAIPAQPAAASCSQLPD